MNPHDLGRFCTESLESAAKRYKTLGFSIIPLNGARNPQQPKLPVIKWARFQHTHASDEELQIWFNNQPHAGIGIVCGRISRLMVLDFDNADGVSEFRHLCSDLVDTFTVRSGTRKLPHFYYRLPEGKLIPTSSYPGVDLRGEGSYVVGFPTRVGKAAWMIEHDALIREVSEFDVRRIMRFLASRKVAVESPKAMVESVPVAEVSEFRHPTSDTDLVAYYHKHVSKGRNQALFQTALLARDLGMTEALCGLTLASVHASEPGKEHESYEGRYAEAIGTIASAYSRPARQQATTVDGLGNAIREWFMGHGLTNVARVLDGLYAVGMKANELFTEFNACRRLACLGIGRRSIMGALKALIGDWALFEARNPPLNPPVPAGAARGSEDLNNSCEMSRGAKRVKNKRGRPAKSYQLPSSETIASKIGVSGKSDPLIASEVLGSPKAYRQALHTELLARRPGHYGRAWLSERLGMSRWTARRYEKAAGIEVRPAYASQVLSWASAAVLPEKACDSPKGVFIEAKDGRRYPAVRGLALRLIKTGNSLVLKHQQGNFYQANRLSVGIPTPYSVMHTSSASNQWLSKALTTMETDRHEPSVGIPTPQPNAPPDRQRSDQEKRKDKYLSAYPLHTNTSLGVGIPTPPEVEPVFWLCPECLNFHIMTTKPTYCARCEDVTDWEIVPAQIWQDAQALKHWWMQRYRDHRKGKDQRPIKVISKPQMETRLEEDAKALIERLHRQIPNLSFTNARKLVRQFSVQLIEKALAVVQGREQLRNPAGFLITFLRSESNRSTNIKSDTLSSMNQEKKNETAVDWLRKLVKSEYLSFISNVDDILNLNFDEPTVGSEV